MEAGTFRDFEVPLGHLLPGAACPRLRRAVGGFPNDGTRSFVAHPTPKPTALGAPVPVGWLFPGRGALGQAQLHLGVSAEAGQELWAPRGGLAASAHPPMARGCLLWHARLLSSVGPSARVGVGSPPLLIKKDSFLGPLWGWCCEPHLSLGTARHWLSRRPCMPSPRPLPDTTRSATAGLCPGLGAPGLCRHLAGQAGGPVGVSLLPPPWQMAARGGRPGGLLCVPQPPAGPG